jgi:hypothetical protein
MRPLYIYKESVNLRAKNSTQSHIKKTLTDGDPVFVKSNTSGWYHIITDDGLEGWLRSDLAAPEMFSKTRMAAAFNDTIMPALNRKIFFDKTNPFKILYTTLKNDDFKNINNAIKEIEKIGKKYQTYVYPGEIEIRVMKNEGKRLFKRVSLKPLGLANVPVPILDFGILLDLKVEKNEVAIKLEAGAFRTDKELLKLARKISALYGVPFTASEILIVNQTNTETDNEICRLFYLEDSDGEYYKFNECR